jgi:hypothetical protein
VERVLLNELVATAVYKEVTSIKELDERFTRTALTRMCVRLFWTLRSLNLMI